MSKEEIFNKIKDLIAENFDVDKDTRLLKVLALPTIWMLIQLT